MDGIIVMRQGAFERRGQPCGDGNWSDLIIRNGDIEITIDTMPKGTIGFISSEGEDAVEMNYVLEGKMVIRGPEDSVVVTTGDVYCLKGLAEYTMFEVLEDMRVIYINNASLFNIHEERIAGLMQVLNQLQAGDGDTLRHCERVKALCMGIAYHIQLERSKLNVLLYAARFHDVGKARIPLEILLKPGKLTTEEFETVKLHSQYTYEMIHDCYGEEIAEAAYEHHERLDGGGYPRHLKGEEIGLPARIICVADAYDAMVTTRPYHSGVQREEALAELWRCAGKQFDARVIRALEEYLKTY